MRGGLAKRQTGSTIALAVEWACAAGSQEGANVGASAAGTSDEIVVTARRREESLSPVPIAISLIGLSSIAGSNI